MARDDDRDIVYVDRDGPSAVKWFVVGALLGAGAALLFAPQSGPETRRQIKRRVRKLRAMAEEKLDDIADEFNTRKAQVREFVRGTEDDLEEAFDDTKHRVERTVGSAREELERRLAQARRRRREAVQEVEDDEEPVA